MREDEKSLGLSSESITKHRHTHTHTHMFWWAVLHWSYPLPDQRCSPGHFRSLSALQEPNSPSSSQLYQCHPSLLIFSLLSLRLSLSLINQCQAVQQQGRHSFPACLLGSSYMSLCPDPPPPPTQQPPSSFHKAAELKPGPHCQHESLRDRVRKRKSEEEAFLSLLSFLPPFSCLPPARGRKGFHSRLHNSWDTQEKTGHWEEKKFRWSSCGEWRDMYASLCAPDPSSPLLSIHHHSPHTQSLSHVCR